MTTVDALFPGKKVVCRGEKGGDVRRKIMKG